MSSSQDPSRWENPLLPEWVRDLKPLKSYVGTLTEFARDPVNFVRTVISVVLVGGAIDMGQALIDALLAVGEAFVALPELSFGLLGSAGATIGNSVLLAANWYVGLIEATAASLGPFGIFLQIGAYALSIVLLIQAIPPLLNALSDLLGAIPVVGSVLDAVLTFAIGFAESLAAVFGGEN